MKEYIKKFESASAADNYAIADIPFTSTIEESLTNLVCNQENKKIVVDGDSIDVVDAGPAVFTLTIEGNGLSKTIQYEEGMTWEEWYNSDYCTEKYHWDDDEYCEVDGWEAEHNISRFVPGIGEIYCDFMTYIIAGDGSYNRIELNSLDDVIDKEGNYVFAFVSGVIGGGND